ncbi:succinyl-diaminopimelate desuccinylase [Kushneria phosphatilytica]|uniref:succinyl-diaminopimelate desuccinylase n=1 Tax=Kushneria phosphatilytica TaxID=657387 RepID=UPI0008D9D733|nr:succinyl-diaminopimelate desuccinylase [Kushneria phosphatilytica]OHV10466.1 succinyl-diaminopimelate desuccinylase [Kushneria phosphatilytica]
MPSGHSDTLALAIELLSRRSLTPEDAGCQALLGERLVRLGFTLEAMDQGGVTNLWATRGSGDTLILAGHTDVVPTGPEQQWESPPFEPTLNAEGDLCARGAADMKGSLAAMVTAVERFVTAHPDHHGRLALLITSDEEGPAVDGTRDVVEQLRQRGERAQWCIVGEPSSSEYLGDTIKNGRRGSLGGQLTIHGIQGHVAYPQSTRNPIHQAAPALAALVAEQWDVGNEHFPATSFQISNMHAGTGATNVVPGELEVIFNFRFSTEVTADALRQRTQAILDAHGLDYTLDWTLFGEPFLTHEGQLLEAVVSALESVTGRLPRLSTAGGTSDGRFIAAGLEAQVVELGPCNATIHKVNERVRASDLDTLSQAFETIMQRLLG